MLNKLRGLALSAAALLSPSLAPAQTAGNIQCVVRNQVADSQGEVNTAKGLGHLSDIRVAVETGLDPLQAVDRLLTSACGLQPDEVRVGKSNPYQGTLVVDVGPEGHHCLKKYTASMAALPPDMNPNTTTWMVRFPKADQNAQPIDAKPKAAGAPAQETLPAPQPAHAASTQGPEGKAATPHTVVYTLGAVQNMPEPTQSHFDTGNLKSKPYFAHRGPNGEPPHLELKRLLDKACPGVPMEVGFRRYTGKFSVASLFFPEATDDQKRCLYGYALEQEGFAEQHGLFKRNPAEEELSVAFHHPLYNEIIVKDYRDVERKD